MRGPDGDLSSHLERRFGLGSIRFPGFGNGDRPASEALSVAESSMIVQYDNSCRQQ
jgi:hypothetical protein